MMAFSSGGRGLDRLEAIGLQTPQPQFGSEEAGLQNGAGRLAATEGGALDQPRVRKGADWQANQRLPVSPGRVASHLSACRLHLLGLNLSASALKVPGSGTILSDPASPSNGLAAVHGASAYQAPRAASR
jgi:hypothetical protein